MAEDGGHLITLFVSCLCKLFIVSYLEARGIEPLFPRQRPARSRTGFIREDSKTASRDGNAWMELDVISFVIRWPAFGDIRNLNTPSGAARGQTVQTVYKSVSLRSRKSKVAPYA